MNDLNLALAVSERLIGLAIALQSIELLQLRKTCSDTGIWSFALLNEEYAALPRPLAFVCARVLRYRAYVALLVLRLSAALALLAFDLRAALPCLLIASLLVCVRFRGSFNGGSDSMTIQILFGLSGAALAPGSRLAAVCFGYIGLQALLSYFIAGLIKLKQPGWRNGDALARLSAAPQYAAPRALRRLFEQPALRRTAAWSVLAFECCFPLSLTSVPACTVALGLGLSFHLANAVLFGLNRFVFAWLAAYPALFWLSTLR